MAITDYNPLNGNVRLRLGKVLQAVRELAAPPPAPPKKRRNPARRTARQVAEAARAAAVNTYLSDQEKRGAPGEPATVTEGAGAPKIPGPEVYHDKEQQNLLGRRSTRYERFAARGGWGPIGWSTHRELTLDRIRQIHNEVDMTGWMVQKDDTDRTVLRKDAHILGVDRARRSKVYRAPLVVRPCDKSAEAAIVCNFVRQVFDNYDGLLDGVSDMLYANAAGVSAQEVTYTEPAPMQVVIGNGSTATMTAEGLAELAPIWNRYLRFDVQTDRPWIDMGNKTVDPFIDPDTLQPSYKVLIHQTFGDGHARQRGYMFAGHYLHSFKQLSWEKWITVLETFGAVNPYLVQRGGGFTSDEDREDALDALANHGTGKPAVIHERWGDLKHAPIPSGVDARGMHAAIIGAINSELSKAVQGETLTAEMGGVGSYKASEIHENQQESIQWIDARRTAVTLRNLARFLVAVNADELARLTGLPPEVVKTLVPRIGWFLDRTVDPVARLGMFDTIKNKLGIAIDDDQVRDEFHVQAPPDQGVATPAPEVQQAPA